MAVEKITGFPATDIRTRWFEVPFLQQPDSNQCGFVSFFASLYMMLNPQHEWNSIDASDELILSAHGCRILRHAFAALYVGIPGLTIRHFLIDTRTTPALPLRVEESCDILELPLNNHYAVNQDHERPGIFQVSIGGPSTTSTSLAGRIAMEQDLLTLTPMLSSFENDMETWYYSDLQHYHEKVQRLFKNVAQNLPGCLKPLRIPNISCPRKFLAQYASRKPRNLPKHLGMKARVIHLHMNRL